MKTSIKHRISHFFNWNVLSGIKSMLAVSCCFSVCISGLSAQEIVLSATFSEKPDYVENTVALNKPEKDVKPTRTAAIFNGGKEFKNIDQFITARLVFPSEAVGTGVYGMVKVRFEILKDGKIGEMMILESPGKAFDRAVADLLAQMPAWTPASENGLPRNSVYQLKLNFRLQ